MLGRSATGDQHPAVKIVTTLWIARLDANDRVAGRPDLLASTRTARHTGLLPNVPRHPAHVSFDDSGGTDSRKGLSETAAAKGDT